MTDQIELPPFPAMSSAMSDQLRAIEEARSRVIEIMAIPGWMLRHPNHVHGLAVYRALEIVQRKLIEKMWSNLENQIDPYTCETSCASAEPESESPSSKQS